VAEVKKLQAALALTPDELRLTDLPATARPAAAVAAVRRVALVIGNSAYRDVPVLNNPKRDGESVAAALQLAGFQTVQLAADLDRDGMMKTLRAFRDEADKADWALVYFAGHGIEMNRTNYLIPIDAKLADERDVTGETVSYEELLKTIEGARMLRLVILDACRDNPFKRRMHRGIGARGGLDRGLAPPPEQAPGTLIVYSAKEGDVALDEDGSGNSPFARAFVNQIKSPGREIHLLFDYVRDDVLRATNSRQQPWTYGSVGKQEFYFIPAKSHGGYQAPEISSATR